MLRGVFLFVHVLGIVLWLGVTLSLSFVTGRARREGHPEVTAFAYRVNDRILRTLGLAGMLLTVGGGIGLVVVVGSWNWFRPFPNHWLFQMQLLGFLSFGAAAFLQIPLGRRLAEAAEESARESEATDRFEKLRKRYALVSSVVGFVLLLTILLGTVRPM